MLPGRVYKPRLPAFVCHTVAVVRPFFFFFFADHRLIGHPSYVCVARRELVGPQKVGSETRRKQSGLLRSRESEVNSRRRRRGRVILGLTAFDFFFFFTRPVLYNKLHENPNGDRSTMTRRRRRRRRLSRGDGSGGGGGGSPVGKALSLFSSPNHSLFGFLTPRPLLSPARSPTAPTTAAGRVVLIGVFNRVE